MASIRAFIVRQISRQYMKRVHPGRDVHDLRHGFELRTGLLPVAHGVTVQKESIDGIDCEWHVPEGCKDAPLIYYLHGGAYMMGSPATHRRLVSHIARAAGMRAVLPDYRLAPENRFPSALEDSLCVWKALMKGGQDPANIAIGGDSAGGNLAMATLLSLRDAGEALPAACFLMSPWLDLSGDGDSHHSRSAYDPWFKPDYLPVIARRFCADDQFRDPLVSPVFADASGLPPTLIQVGDHEILLSDSSRMADNINAAGGRVELQIWPKMWHVFQFFIGQMPESSRAIDDIGRFLRMALSADRNEIKEGRAA
jgi:acetyl esterase/lipase